MRRSSISRAAWSCPDSSRRTSISTRRASWTAAPPNSGTLDEAIAQVSAGQARSSPTTTWTRAQAARSKRRSATARRTCARTSRSIPASACAASRAIKRVAAAYRWAVDIEICVFPQEGLTNNPGTEELMREALGDGAHVVGAAPYTDADPHAQIDRVFAHRARLRRRHRHASRSRRFARPDGRRLRVRADRAPSLRRARGDRPRDEAVAGSARAASTRSRGASRTAASP